VRVDVIIYPSPAENRSFTGQTAIILDILRATSTMVTALGNKASQVIPVLEPDAALQLKQKFDAELCIVGGERQGIKIAGFDLGNSPAEFTKEKVAGKTVILSTTNGTKAALWARGAREIIIGSFLNMAAIDDYLKSNVSGDTIIVCSGRDGGFSLEDFTGAGMIAGLLESAYELSDMAKAAKYTYEKALETGLTTFVGQTEHGLFLTESGMGSDIAWCTALNKYPILPKMVDGVIKIL
jgi:2-phosphosulfolactate phosphatase